MGSLGGIATIGVKVGLATALALGAVAVLRWLHQNRFSLSASARSLRVTEAVALGPHRCLHLVSVGSRTFLIATTQSQVALLAEVSGAAPAPEQGRVPRSRPISFPELLGRLSSGQGGDEDCAARLGAAARALGRTAGEEAGAWR